MRLSIWEGSCYALMVGVGETYYIADAVRHGASPLVLGLLVGLPLFVGGAGPLIALALLVRLGHRRLLVATTALCQALMLVAIALLDPVMTPLLLVALVCLHHFFGLATGSVWASWYGDLVPKEIRGRYFARRTRIVHLVTCGGLLLGGLLLSRLEPGAAGEVQSGQGGRGFVLIFLLAGASRLVSALLLLLSPEPPLGNVAGPGRSLKFLRTARGTSAWKVIVLGASMQLVVYVGSPYFAPFMLKELRLDYTQYMAAAMAVTAMKFVSLPGWGQVVDLYGARPVFGVAALLVAAVPFPWILSEGLVAVLLAQSLSGFAWGSYEVSFFSLALESSTRQVRPQIFAALNIMNGAAQLAGSLAGYALFATLGSYRAIFAASLVLRLAVAVMVPLLLPRALGTSVRRHTILLRVIGFRAHGGVAHRPIVEEDGDGQ
jgi:MFS family permease